LPIPTLGRKGRRTLGAKVIVGAVGVHRWVPHRCESGGGPSTTFHSLEDGHASRRVVDAVFGPGTDVPR